MKNKKTIVIIVIALLTLGLGIVSFLFIEKNQENKEMAALFELEKEEMENEYTHFATQYRFKSTMILCVSNWKMRN